MKFLKLTFSCIAMIFITNAYAANELIPFTTPAEAEENCPSINNLTFIPNFPSLPNSAGVIKGMNKNVLFESFPKTAIHPKNLDASGLIQDAQLRTVDGMYGYKSDALVVCYYNYVNYADVQYLLTMRGKSQ